MKDTTLGGRYRIGPRLGEGGMATVHKATDVVLNRVVAVKILRSQYAGDEEFVERFRREARAAASLSHPNVVNIFDVGQDGDVHYIVLEYVQGQNLKQILRAQGRLEPRRAARIATAVARALQAAHDRGLVHRDVKPHNILITSEGRVKVTDFGIAHATSATGLTETGMVVGSAHYFSPEQARGHTVGPAADLYSLGVVLYEMLTGRAPFQGDSPVAVALKHLQEAPMPPRELVKSIPPWLDDVVMKALAKRPSHRYRSAAQMAVDLAWRTSSGGAVEGTGAAVRLGSSRRGGAAFGERTRPFGSAVPGGGAEPKGFDPENRPPPIFDPEDRMFDDAAAAQEPEGEKSRRPRRRRRWLVPLLALFLLGAGVYVATPFVLSWIFPPEVDVPHIAGLTYGEARPLIEDAGLRLRVDAEVADRHVPEGAIVRQSPEGGRTVRRGREVAVVLSRGPEIDVLPDVTGQPVRDARVQLTRAGFTLAAEEAVSEPGTPVNEVVAQDPLPGAELAVGSPVTLWVNKPDAVAAAAVEVPDFRGQSVAEAEGRLETLGLVVGNKWSERHPLVPPGRIIDQNPGPGTTVEAGGTVDFVFSEGFAPGPTVGEAGRGVDEPGDGEGAPPEQDPPLPPTAGTEGVEGASPREEDVSGGEEAAGGAAPAPEVDWDEVLRAESGDGGRRRAKVDVYVPPGAPREVVVLVIDDFGVREALREIVPGDTSLEQLVDGRGESARLQVYVDGVMQTDAPFPEL